MTLKAERETARIEAIAELRKRFPIGSSVPVVLRHVSSSGMSRAISVLDGDLNDVSYLVARATGDKVDQRHGGIKIGGCGMDMGFALVYGLSRTLYRDDFYCMGDGPAPAPSCPSNDHCNDRPRNAPGNFDATRLHSDGGYALRHRWI